MMMMMKMMNNNFISLRGGGHYLPCWVFFLLIFWGVVVISLVIISKFLASVGFEAALPGHGRKQANRWSCHHLLSTHIYVIVTHCTSFFWGRSGFSFAASASEMSNSRVSDICTIMAKLLFFLYPPHLKGGRHTTHPLSLKWLLKISNDWGSISVLLFFSLHYSKCCK